MTQQKILRRIAIASCLIAGLFSQTAWGADWKIDNHASDFHFVTTKAGAPGTSTITEVHRFKQISGSVADDGKINFSVQTASVDTLIPLRDDRLREILFKSINFPEASFSGQVAMTDIQKLKVGDMLDIDVPGTLNLVGNSKAINAKLRVVRLSADRLLVGTRESLVVNANDYALQAGVETLRTLAGLNVLSPSAPVDFSVVLTR
jgi:polyisoprenoid-binding protein YceI